MSQLAASCHRTDSHPGDGQQSEQDEWLRGVWWCGHEGVVVDDLEGPGRRPVLIERSDAGGQGWDAGEAARGEEATGQGDQDERLDGAVWLKLNKTVF